jgi:uncharacterized protein
VAETTERDEVGAVELALEIAPVGVVAQRLRRLAGRIRDAIVLGNDGVAVNLNCGRQIGTPGDSDSTPANIWWLNRALYDTKAAAMDDSNDIAPVPVNPTEPTRIDPRLLEILVCPVTRATLEYDSKRQELISRAAKLAYPIRDGIPIMLPEEARALED